MGGGSENDETNVLSALLSNKLKAKNSLVVYSKSEYQNIINSIGAEREVNIKYSVAGEINSYVMRKKFSHETIIDENTKVFEFKAKMDLDFNGSSSTIVALVMRGADEVRIITDLDDKKILKDDYAIVVTLDQEAEKSLETVILE